MDSWLVADYQGVILAKTKLGWLVAEGQGVMVEIGWVDGMGFVGRNCWKLGRILGLGLGVDFWLGIGV